MKICGTCKSDPTHREMMDEIRFNIGSLAILFENLELYQNKTIIIELLDLKDAKLSYNKLADLIKENNNIVVDCYDLHDYISLSKLHPRRIMYHYPCESFNDLYRIISYQPCAIMIGEPLTFNLKTVRSVVDDWYDYYINLRVLPMLGRPTEWTDLREQDNGIKHFWIAPHLIPIYDDYIDVIDLYDTDVQREQALIEIYTAQRYMLPIGSVVKNLESSLPAEMFNEDFAIRRLNCHQTCMRGNSGCHYCEQFEKLANILKPQVKQKEFTFENGKII